MFNELQALAKQRLNEISQQLTGVSPINTGTLSFTVAQALNSSEQLLKSVEKIAKKELPYIYTLSASGEIDADQIRLAFSTAKAKKRNNRAYARLNTEASPCFYVGSSYDFLKRFREHIGYGAKTTYALHLSHWAQDFPDLELIWHYAQYQEGTSQDLLQALEDTLWEKKMPMFGRKGSK